MIVKQIMDRLPHRYPFLLVDRVVAVKPGVSARGYKLVSLNEPVLQGHFPGRPVFPGVMLLEALAQVGGLLLVVGKASPERANEVPVICRVHDAKFLRLVTPGDRVDLQCTFREAFGNFATVDAVATVEADKVCTARITYALGVPGP